MSADPSVPLLLPASFDSECENEIMSSYDSHTINSSNPLARYAHRNRLKRSIKLALPRLSNGMLLDYGCGSGVFVSELNSLVSECAVGYEPFMKERYKDDLPVYSTLDDVDKM